MPTHVYVSSHLIDEHATDLQVVIEESDHRCLTGSQSACTAFEIACAVNIYQERGKERVRENNN